MNRFRRWDALIVLGTLAVGCGRAVQSFALLDSTSVDVIEYGEHTGPLPGTALTDSSRVPYINYFARPASRESIDSEVDLVAELLVRSAEQRGDTLILVQRTTPLIARALPFIRGELFVVRRGPLGVWSHLDAKRQQGPAAPSWKAHLQPS